jgi:uncharacterized protein
MAALSHALVIVAGIIAPLIIWFLYKDKSKFVKRQAMQAAITQLVGVVIFVACFIVFFVFAFATMGFGALCMPVLFVPVLGLFGVEFFAAYKCYQGEDFKVPMIYEFVEKM